MPADARGLLVGADDGSDAHSLRAPVAPRRSWWSRGSRTNRHGPAGSDLQSAARFLASWASYSAFFARMPAITFSGFLATDFRIANCRSRLAICFSSSSFSFSRRARRRSAEFVKSSLTVRTPSPRGDRHVSSSFVKRCDGSPTWHGTALQRQHRARSLALRSILLSARACADFESRCSASRLHFALGFGRLAPARTRIRRPARSILVSPPLPQLLGDERHQRMQQPQSLFMTHRTRSPSPCRASSVPDTSRRTHPTRSDRASSAAS